MFYILYTKMTTSRNAYLETGWFEVFEFGGRALSDAASEGALTTQAFTFLLADADIVDGQKNLQRNIDTYSHTGSDT